MGKRVIVLMLTAIMLFSVNFTGLAVIEARADAADPEFDIVVSERTPHMLTLTLIMKNCEGVMMTDTVIEFSSKAIGYASYTNGADTETLDSMYKKNNALRCLCMTGVNLRPGNSISVTTVFQTELLSSAEYAALFAPYAGTPAVNSDEFSAIDMKFNISDENTDTVTFTLKSTCSFADGRVKTVEDTYVLTLRDHTHTYSDEWTIISPPNTCANEGVRMTQCTICGRVKYDSVYKAPCVYGDWTLIIAPTATSKGEIEKKCIYCNTGIGDSFWLYDVYHAENPRIDMQQETLVVGAGTTVGELLESVYEGAQVVDLNGKRLAENVPVGSGMTVEFYFSGNKMAALPVAVIGDVDGDGAITAADARLALRASVELEKLTECQEMAANAEREGSVDAGSARKILRASVGLENPDDWIHAD